MIRTLFIDWNRTLSFGRFWGPAAERNPVLFQLLEKRLFQDNRPLLEDWMRGRLSYETVCTRMADADLSADTVDQAFREGFDALFIAPAIQTTLKTLRRTGLPIWVATNHMDVFGRFIYPRFSHLFDGYLCSADIGFFKEELSVNDRPLFFNSFFKKTGIMPEQTALIDNTSKVTNACARCGMHTYLIESPGDVLRTLTTLHAEETRSTTDGTSRGHG